jgi:GNAT superfamily N-acetyltransferase
MSRPVIRVATAGDDLGRASTIIQQAYFALPGYPRDEAYDREIADVAARLATHDVVVIGLVDDVIVGCLTYVPGPRSAAYEFDDPTGASFRYLGVDPIAQGTGVGASMVRWCIDRARADGRARLWIHTLESMPGAARLYERLGFVRTPDADQWWDDVHGHAYVLDL